jgi:hypothetical protein
LHGKGGKSETIGILASRNEARLVSGVVGEVRGIDLVGVGPRVTVVVAGVVAVDVVIILPLGWGAPFGAEDLDIGIDPQRLSGKSALRAPVGVAGVVNSEAEDREPDIAVDLAGGWLVGIVRPKSSGQRG